MTSYRTSMSLIVVVLCLPASSSERQEMRRGWSVWKREGGADWRCRPVNCSVDEEVRRCSVEGEKDRCAKCPAGKINMDAPSSWSNFRCYTAPVCPEGTVKDPHPPPSSASSCNPLCICNPLEGWVGLDSCQCTKVDFTCGVDTFLNIHGHCTACPTGSYKSGLGYGPCLNMSKTDFPTYNTTVTSLMTSKQMTTNQRGTTLNESDSTTSTERPPVIGIHHVKDNENTVRVKQGGEIKGNTEAHRITMTVISALRFLALVAIVLIGLVAIHQWKRCPPAPHQDNTVNNIFQFFGRFRQRSRHSEDRGSSRRLLSETNCKTVVGNRSPVAGTGSASSLHSSTPQLHLSGQQTEPKCV